MHQIRDAWDLRFLPMKTPLTLLAASVVTLASSQAAVVNQTTSAAAGVYWNAFNNWGPNAASAAAPGNTYFTTSGLIGSTASGLGADATFTGRIRDNGTTFAGDSLTISASTQLLLKNGAGATSSANLILNGGIITYGPDGAGGLSANLTGTLNVAANSLIGLGANNTLNINSTVTGSNVLNLRSSDGLTNIISFGGNLAGFTGTIDIGGGPAPVTLDFNQNYTLLASIVMGTHASADIFRLDQNITVNAFTFGANALAANTYTVTQLNAAYGSGTQFTGTGTLTVVPEPASLLFGALGSLVLFRRRRAM